MGDTPLWPRFLPDDHPNNPNLHTLPTIEDKKKYANDMIKPIIREYFILNRRQMNNEELTQYISPWFKNWIPGENLDEFVKSTEGGWRVHLYGKGVQSPYPYAPGAAPPAQSPYPYAPSAAPPAQSLSPYAPGAGGDFSLPDRTLHTGCRGGGCTMVGGKRKKKRKTLRRRRCKKRTRKTRRV